MFCLQAPGTWHVLRTHAGREERGYLFIGASSAVPVAEALLTRDSEPPQNLPVQKSGK